MPRLVLVVVALGLAGCPRVDVSMRGRPCDEGECLAGFTCDRATEICITEGDMCPTSGALSPCAYAMEDCSQGCRVCERGTWSACRELADDCTPGIPSCLGNLLYDCNDDGFLVQGTDCGTPGCNASVSPPRCNLCAPAQTWCEGAQFHECDTYGLPAETTDCAAIHSQCATGWFCDPVGGCLFTTPTVDGSPCDEGLGADGNLCNSSCRAGVCTPQSASCEDGSDCTVDACNPSTGCTTTFASSGTPCKGTDNDRCTSTCDAVGQCVGAAVDCTDENPCTTDQCDNGICSFPAGNAGTVCRPSTEACDVAERCTGTSTTCPADADPVTVTLASSVTHGSQVPVTVTLPCSGELSHLACTTEMARFCIEGPLTFEGTMDGFSGGGVSNADCGDGGMPNGNCRDNDGGGDVLELSNSNTTARRTTTLDTTGYTDLRLHVRAAFHSSTDLGEIAAIFACCDDTSCSTQIGTIASAADSGSDYWNNRPCTIYGCQTDGYFMDVDDCTEITTGFFWDASINEEVLHIDEHIISGNAALTLPLVDNGDNTYSTSFQPCGQESITVVCRWDYRSGTTGQATTTVE